MCVPTSGWNGDVVVFAHGYVAFNQPLDFYHTSLPDGTSLPTLLQSLGFAFVTTSYRQNGLAILEGVKDIRELVKAFRTTYGPPAHTYLAGVSEGGVIATLLAEQSPDLFTGVLAACGPIGNFREQVNYIGDFRVLFDYFFPGTLPPSPLDISSTMITNWESTYVPAIKARLAANPSVTAQLLRTAGAPVDAADSSTIATTGVGVLWYSTFATNDSRAKLGGNPYDNQNRWFFGSSNDTLLNQRLQRFQAEATALTNITPYQTSGNLTLPLVTLHTTGDQIVPFFHEILYAFKVHTSGRGSWIPIPINRYGHCNFKATEVLAAFALVVLQSTGSQIEGLPQYFDATQAKRDFAQAQRDIAAAQKLPTYTVPSGFELNR